MKVLYTVILFLAIASPLMGNADVPVQKNVRPKWSHIDCHSEDISIRIPRNTHLVVSPKLKIECFSPDKKPIKLPIKGVLEFSEKAGSGGKSICQMSGTALYLLKSRNGNAMICGPKSVKAGIRG